MPHVHELYDFTSSAYIVYKSHILLIHHKKLNFWLAPGGHIELDEEPLQTLWREIEEETGLRKEQLELLEPYGDSTYTESTPSFYLLPLPFNMFVVDYDDTSDHKHIDLCYLLKASTDKVSNQEEEAHDIGWFDDHGMQKLVRESRMPKEVYKRAKLALKLAEPV